MDAVDRKTLLVIIRHAPYGNSLARASLDTALAAAAFDQPVELLFLGEGVLQLIPDQDSAAIDVRNIGKLITSLPLYDIDAVHVDAQAAARYAIEVEQLPLEVRLLDATAVSQLMADCDHLVGF